MRPQYGILGKSQVASAAVGTSPVARPPRFAAARFNTYRFGDCKEKVIDLLSRVTRVAVETMETAAAMRRAKRD